MNVAAIALLPIVQASAPLSYDTKLSAEDARSLAAGLPADGTSRQTTAMNDVMATRPNRSRIEDGRTVHFVDEYVLLAIVISTNNQKPEAVICWRGLESKDDVLDRPRSGVAICRADRVEADADEG